MPVSQGNFSAGPVGLSLVAWVMFRGATGAVVASSGISSVARASAGTYTVTFTTVRPNTDYLTIVTGEAQTVFPADPWSFSAGSKGSANFAAFAHNGSVAADPSIMHVAIYA